jgi:cytochrome P450
MQEDSLSETESLAPQQNYVPEHIPADLVKPFSFFTDPAMSKCPFAATSRLHDRGRIFWNSSDPQFGGSWILTRAEDFRFVLNSPDLFTNKGEAGFSQLVGEAWDLIPLELDPPQHTKFRQLLNPLLSPGAVGKMTPGVTSRAVELIEALRGQGGCEFMSAFGRPFPVSIFMQLMGLPLDQTDTFLKWEWQLLHDPNMQTKVGAAIAIRDYLQSLADERRAHPVGDLTSFVVTAEIDGRKLSDDEVMGTLYLLFVGGLDTVASSLGFFFRHLAEHPDQQARLRANPALIERSIEELLRRFSVVTVHRQCKVDVELGGVLMKAGDWISIVDSLGSLDPEEFANPMEVDLDRRNIRHFGFSFGPHFCLGSHLARRELLIAMREWLARIPPWRLKPGAPIEVHGGGVFGVEHLELEWDAT